MNSQAIRGLFLLILSLLYITVSFAEEIPSKDDLRIAWLKQHAIPLRSIDPNDEDFTDLEPLVKIFKDVRIIQLGEQSHGDGATFHAKTRLVKFLHQKLGFDVLAFESGLYDCHKAWELLQGGMEPYEAFSHGVFSLWSGSEQVRPLIDYWGKVAKSERPLELCGFDCQVSGRASRGGLLVKDVTALWDKLGTAAPDSGQRTAIVEILPSLAKWHKRSSDERQQWRDAMAAWRKALETARPSDALPEAELAFWRQFVASTSIFIDMHSLRDQEDAREGARRKSWNLRDSQAAHNLIWLARTVYPRRRIIVWAASSHIARNPIPRQDLTPMGLEVWKALGNETYTVAFTAAEGEGKVWYWAKAGQLRPPVPGSLEDLFVQAGFTNAFLDFRGLTGEGAWLRHKLIARPLGYGKRRANWTDMFDGIVFIKNMFPSTKRDND